MKRILVIDESEVIRETLALILGREFAVAKRVLGTAGLPRVGADEDVDLLIIGLSPHNGLETASLLRRAAQLPFAVLFLVESKSSAGMIEIHGQVDCLAKPFNPYELQEKVGQLLARRGIAPKPNSLVDVERRDANARFIEFPYLSRSAANLARRFAATSLPLLIHGEVGCGQRQVARAIERLELSGQSPILINGWEISADYLNRKGELVDSLDAATTGGILLRIEGLDQASMAAQALLLDFLSAQESRLGAPRLISTANADLLARVYRGEFLDSLYYKLATLTLKLAPLRERREDIALISDEFARVYGMRLNRGAASFSAEARARLANYLWFGNLQELETVVARSLALSRGERIEADDLFFDFGGANRAERESDLIEFVPAQGEPDQPSQTGAQRLNGYAQSVDINTLIHELAHEFKNPMVTIKTFAQLLGERYQDENFRLRFQEVVGGDIERMDDLLEVMIEFADFHQPRPGPVALEDHARAVLNEIRRDCTKRQARFEWKKNGPGAHVRSDEKQLAYILKNVLLAVLAEVKMGSEIEIDLSQAGALVITYLREGARVASVTHYLNRPAGSSPDGILPLRVLLAKQLVERNGGRFSTDQSHEDKDIVRLEFPIVEYGKEN